MLTFSVYALLQMACTIQRTAQSRSLRADAIRPYNYGGTATLPVQCLLTLWKKFYAEFLLLSSAFFAIIEKILGKYTLAAFGEYRGGYL